MEYMTSRASMVNAVVLVFTLISGLAVLLRLFIRGIFLRQAGVEDAFIAFAMALSIGLAIAIAVQIQNGLGWHIDQLTPQQKITSLKAFWASVWLYNLSLTTTKISILLQYLRVFPVPRFRIMCYIVLGVVAIYGTWTLFGSIYLCLPVSFFWDKSIPGGKCLNQSLVWFMNAGVNIAQDAIILFMPIPVLRSLDIPKRQKQALIGVFALGGLVCLVSIVRLHTIVKISNSTDPTFDNPPAAMFSAIETNVGILCACLPSLRPLLTAMMPNHVSNQSQHTNTRTMDEERPKYMQHYSANSRSYSPASASKTSHSRAGSYSGSYKSGHSRTASGSSKASYKPSHSRTASGSSNTSYKPNHTRTASATSDRSYKNGYSRNGSTSSTEPYRAGHSRTVSASSQTYSGNGNGLGIMYNHQASLITIGGGANGPTRQPSRNNEYQRYEQNPLRMSPFSPPIPRLPRLPEHVATFGPIEATPLSPIELRIAPRRPVFQKPLPVTPFPVMPS